MFSIICKHSHRLTPILLLLYRIKDNIISGINHQVIRVQDKFLYNSGSYVV